jgi:hypothetical protein
MVWGEPLVVGLWRRVGVCYPDKNQWKNSSLCLLYAPQWRLHYWMIATLKPDCSNSGLSVFESLGSHSVSSTAALLDPDPIHSRWDSLDGGISPSQGRYLHTEQHKHRINASDIHASSGIRIHDPSIWAGEDRSWLRLRCHTQFLGFQQSV